MLGFLCFVHEEKDITTSMNKDLSPLVMAQGCYMLLDVVVDFMLLS